MKLMKPAVLLMNRLTYPQKFLLISLILIVPLMLSVQVLMSELGDRIAFSQKELDGSNYLVPLRQLWEQAAESQYQAVSLRDRSVDQNQIARHAQLEQAITELNLLDRNLGKSLRTTETHTQVIAAWQHLNTTVSDSEQSHQAAYQELIKTIHALRSHVGNTSNLILDPDLDTYYLMDASLLKLPDMQKLLVELRLQSQRIQQTQTLDSHDRAALITLAGLLQEASNELAANLEVGFENNPARNLRPRLTQPLINFTTAIGVLTADLNLLRDPSVKADPAAYAAKASSNLALSFQLWDQVVTELDILLDQRIRGYVRRRQMVIVGVAIVLAIVTYLFIGFYLTVMQTVSSLDRAAKQMTTGDVTQPITLDNRDELGQVVHSFNTVAAALVQANQAVKSLNQKLEVENLRMSAELTVTRELQRMILPKARELEQIPELDIAGFMEPASEVGGDYYDVLRQDGRVKIGIGDVTGHGLESGVLMIMVQTAVRALLANNETDPVKFLSSLNRAIYDNVQRMDSEKNLTLALIDYYNGKLCLSGQHEEMIVARATGTVERIDTIDLGFPIGLEENISSFISQAEVMLEVGDAVVLYTDGITEAENSHKQQYGLDRLCQKIQRHHNQSANEIRQAIVEDVQAFIGGHIQYDDITLLVLKQK